ncbi:Ypt/Rab-GAP of gyp1p [Glarea lozoyensis ATCC 20868]|uniref:Ypt/Rab-GAP of gyp1p n=1 Tax=Glarea lozoyensis (strain ATCC 20868 / MF5171) TaxID=1116229 RepID=S3CLP1_GLAL2|nr:Ypt/Rab-GAP of gyp1p [Glarea lozoyensis ATCC 20868]EPE26119.1 Ypt/Rab-GAP of gyp1p [Glarea lozoyensis ATCC 20868]
MEPHGSPLEESETGVSRQDSSSPSRLAEKHDTKTAAIIRACNRQDLESLRSLATSEGGLVSDDLRRRAWPLLLGPTEDPRDDWRELPKHRDEDQVELDVNRSFIFYPNDQSAKDLAKRKKELSELITEVLRRQPFLCYFQGYHDICQVFLLVLEPLRRAPVVARLSTLRIRDFMLPTLTPALAQLRLIPSILYAVSPKLYHHLSQTQPFFALSGTLTMYAHDIQEYGDIARLFDVFLAREAAFSVYMFAQIVLQRSDELFETPADEPEMLHSILSKLPQPLDLEALIKNTVGLIENHPPESLKPWSLISKYSVLKTTRRPGLIVEQTLEFGEQDFRQQVKELERAERQEKLLQQLWKYRRPARTIGFAVAVAVLSFWIRRSQVTTGIFEALWHQLSQYKKA